MLTASASAGTIRVAVTNNDTRVTVAPDISKRLDDATELGVPCTFAGPVAFLATDGGVHTPQAWARVTCEQLIQIEPSHDGNFAHEFKTQVRDSLEQSYITILAGERRALNENEARLDSACDFPALAAPVIERIVNVAADTPWAGHFANDTTVRAIEGVIVKDLHTAVLLERQAFARTKDSDTARAFLDRMQSARDS